MAAPSHLVPRVESQPLLESPTNLHNGVSGTVEDAHVLLQLCLEYLNVTVCG